MYQIAKTESQNRAHLLLVALGYSALFFDLCLRFGESLLKAAQVPLGVHAFGVLGRELLLEDLDL